MPTDGHGIQIDIEAAKALSDPLLVYPLDVTRARATIFHYTNMGKDENDPTVEMRWKVRLFDDGVLWCLEELGYMPVPHLLRSVDYEHFAFQLRFRCEADAVLFRIQFGHLF